jgi:hypothetical protein
MGSGLRLRPIRSKSDRACSVLRLTAPRRLHAPTQHSSQLRFAIVDTQLVHAQWNMQQLSICLAAWGPARPHARLGVTQEGAHDMPTWRHGTHDGSHCMHCTARGWQQHCTRGTPGGLAVHHAPANCMPLGIHCVEQHSSQHSPRNRLRVWQWRLAGRPLGTAPKPRRVATHRLGCACQLLVGAASPAQVCPCCCRLHTRPAGRRIRLYLWVVRCLAWRLPQSGSSPSLLPLMQSPSCTSLSCCCYRCCCCCSPHHQSRFAFPWLIRKQGGVAFAVVVVVLPQCGGGREVGGGLQREQFFLQHLQPRPSTQIPPPQPWQVHHRAPKRTFVQQSGGWLVCLGGSALCMSLACRRAGTQEAVPLGLVGGQATTHIIQSHVQRCIQHVRSWLVWFPFELEMAALVRYTP